MYTRYEVQVHHHPFRKDCLLPYPIRGYRFQPPRMVVCHCRLSIPCETTRVTLQTHLQRAFQRVTWRDGTWMQEHHHEIRQALHERKAVSILLIHGKYVARVRIPGIMRRGCGGCDDILEELLCSVV